MTKSFHIVQACSLEKALSNKMRILLLMRTVILLFGFKQPSVSNNLFTRRNVNHAQCIIMHENIIHLLHSLLPLRYFFIFIKSSRCNEYRWWQCSLNLGIKQPFLDLVVMKWTFIELDALWTTISNMDMVKVTLVEVDIWKWKVHRHRNMHRHMHMCRNTWMTRTIWSRWMHNIVTS